MIGCPLENHPGHKNRDTPFIISVAASNAAEGQSNNSVDSFKESVVQSLNSA